jgi:hypothetical protein
MFGINCTISIMQESAGLPDEVAAMKSEFKQAKVTLIKSNSETVEAKFHRLENQVDEDFAFIHSKLNKLSCTQVQQVGTFILLY